jgi:peptidoglycan biosynthesis protein MviN/MurJ (putative lipid II flippase)
MVHLTSLGHAGLAIATSAVAIFGFVALLSILRGRINGIHGRALLKSVSQISLASAVMGVMVALVSQVLANRLGDSRMATLANVALSIPVGAVVFYGTCRFLKVTELEMAGRALISPAQAWFSRQRAKI